MQRVHLVKCCYSQFYDVIILVESANMLLWVIIIITSDRGVDALNITITPMAGIFFTDFEIDFSPKTFKGRLDVPQNECCSGFSLRTSKKY